MGSATKRPFARRAVTVLAIGILVMLPAAPALAHGADDSTRSRVLVLDALAYLANQPTGFEDSVKDKVKDALDAPDKAGVNLTKVAAAQKDLASGSMEAASMTEVRTLLQASVLPMTEPITGEDPGTTVMLDPMPGSTTWAGSGAVYAGLSALAILIGGWLAIRSRPRDSLRSIRAGLVEGSQP